MWRKILLASAFALLVPSLALAQIVELEGRYWFLDLDGNIRTDRGDVTGTSLDLTKDLDLDGENAPGVKLTFGLPLGNKIRGAYSHLLSEGDATLQETITFAGTTFAANTQVHSELEVHYAQLGWLWMPSIIPGVLKIGPIIELKFAQIEGEIETRNANPAIRESKEMSLILPTFGGALEFTPHRVIQLYVEASGVPAGNLGHFLDAEAGIRIVPFPLLAIVGGYRLLDLRIDHDDDFAEVRMNGPFVGVSLRF